MCIYNYTGYIEKLLQETIKQCNTGGVDLQDEQEPKPHYVLLLSDLIKQLQYSSIKVDLVLLLNCSQHVILISYNSI